MSPWLSDLVLRSQSDERLVSLAQAGHDRAFVAIVERYERRLLGFAAHLGAGGRAEDVVQQAFLSAFAALRAEREVTHLSGWLHQIVRNGVAGAGARAASELQPETSSGADLEDQVASRIEARSLLAELARLPERQRDALVLTSLQGRSRSEVALSLGTTEGAVRQMLHRARTSLRNAAGAILPMPLVAAAARRSIRGAHLGGATATSVGGGVALKAGAIIAAGGLVAAGLTISHHPVRASRGTTGRAAKVEHRPTFSASLLGRMAPGHSLAAGEPSPEGGKRASDARVGAPSRRLGETPRAGGSGAEPRQTSGEAAPTGSDIQRPKQDGSSGGASQESGTSGSGTSSSSGSAGGSGQDGTGEATSATSSSGDSSSTDSSSTDSSSTDSSSTNSGSTGTTGSGSHGDTSTSGTSTDSSGVTSTSGGG